MDTPTPHLWRTLSTVEAAALINEMLGADVYGHRHIRAEIDAGRLRAHPRGRGRNSFRPRLRIAAGEFLRWADQVLQADEMTRLRARLSA